MCAPVVEQFVKMLMDMPQRSPFVHGLRLFSSRFGLLVLLLTELVVARATGSSRGSLAQSTGNAEKNFSHKNPATRGLNSCII